MSDVNDYWYAKNEKGQIRPEFKNCTVEWKEDFVPPGRFNHCRLEKVTFKNIAVSEEDDFFKGAELTDCSPSGATFANPSNFGVVKAKDLKSDLGKWFNEDDESEPWFEREVNKERKLYENNRKIHRFEEENKRLKSENQQLKDELKLLKARNSEKKLALLLEKVRKSGVSSMKALKRNEQVRILVHLPLLPQLA